MSHLPHFSPRIQSSGAGLEPDLSQDVQRALKNAQQAYRAGDRRLARRWAERAVTLAPNRAETWMWLAALASPQASVAYLRRALELQPESEAARKAMHWAIRRLRAEQPTKPVRLDGSAAGRTMPVRVSGAPRRGALVEPSIPAANWVQYRSLFTLPNVAGVAVLLVLGVMLCFLIAAAPFVQSAFAEDSLISIAQVILDKPTRTPSPTPTFTPTPTPTITPTPTDTPTPLPTDTPVPTETPLPPPPGPDNPPHPGLPEGVEDGENWIDINLTWQMAYAYRGSELINSFLISTGTWQYPTVTGTYQVYVKYRYADMSGPGYYLPDVPYVMYFYEGYGLHGTYWHNNFGTPMSHGCVNFRTEDAGWVFDFVEVGTVVNVHY